MSTPGVDTRLNQGDRGEMLFVWFMSTPGVDTRLNQVDRGEMWFVWFMSTPGVDTRLNQVHRGEMWFVWFMIWFLLCFTFTILFYMSLYFLPLYIFTCLLFSYAACVVCQSTLPIKFYSSINRIRRTYVQY